MNFRSKAIITTLAVTALIAVLQIARILDPLEGGLRVMFLPVVRGMASLGDSTRNALLGSPEAKVLKERNSELEARLASLIVDYVRLRSLEEENRSLQALIKFQNDTGYDNLPARIIAQSTDPKSATVMIDRGSRDGVETGMAVVIGDGILVGKVTGLRERVATITLISDESSRIAASALGGKELFGLVEGRGNGVARLTLVPQSADLKRDDVVVTAGTEDKIPANLIVGIINEVEGKATDPFKSASLESLVKPERLSIVMVLLPSVLRPEH
ncbi:rod shape-determining protein MreC [Patescibacteria group bacterium]|nr:rod shape-determining protein MreC [Patescibacteria group bacterium]MBU1908095.1 rod shape-determining protein MreC [Patescibacteria group bacterium]